jgi:predicted DNA-binding transcriptional regulator AlpA
MTIKTHRSEINDAITIREVAEFFRVSIRTIREWSERDSAFPRPFKKFGTLRFRRAEIEEYWGKNTRHPNSNKRKHLKNFLTNE